MPTVEDLAAGVEAANKEFKASTDDIKSLLQKQGEEIKATGVTSAETARKLAEAEKRYDDQARAYEQQRAEFATRTEELKAMQTRLDEMEASLKRGRNGFGGDGETEFKTAGERFIARLQQEEYRGVLEAVAAGDSVKRLTAIPGIQLKSFDGQPKFGGTAREVKTDTPGLGTTASTASGSTLILPYRIPGYIPLPQRKLRIRDLMPVLPATAPSVSFLRQTGFFANSTTAVTSATAANSGSGSLVTVITTTAHGWRTFDLVNISGGTGASAANGTFRITVTNATTFTYFSPTQVTAGAAAGTIVAVRYNNYGNAGFTTEGAQKPGGTMKFTEEIRPIQVLAHWIAATRQILSDFPGLRNDVDNDLIYGTLRREESALLYGSGVSPNIEGILTRADIQPYLWSSGVSTPAKDTQIDAIRRAVTRVQIAELEADGAVIHPIDYEAIETAKGTTGYYIWQYAQAANGEIDRVWRLPLAVTPAINPGTALVGAFQTASALYEKEQVMVRFTDSHADYFTANMLAILAEERIAAIWKRPEAFVQVTFDSAPA